MRYFKKPNGVVISSRTEANTPLYEADAVEVQIAGMDDVVLTDLPPVEEKVSGNGDPYLVATTPRGFSNRVYIGDDGEDIDARWEGAKAAVAVLLAAKKRREAARNEKVAAMAALLRPVSHGSILTAAEHLVDAGLDAREVTK